MSLNHFQSGFASWAPFYDTSAQEDGYVADEKIARAVFDFAAMDKKDKTLVDLGTGTGRVLQKLQGSFAQAIGADFSKEMLQQCRSKNVADHLIECDLTDEKWPIETRCADVVTCAGLLEFIARPEPFLRNVKNIMKPGAVAALTYEKMLPVKKAWGLEKGYRFVPAHMDDAAKGAGLNVCEHEDFVAFRHFGRPVTYGLMVLSL